jgi:hypothetical protein
MPYAKSSCSATADGAMGFVKEGQPVPLSYFVPASKSGVAQTTHLNVPGTFTWRSGEEKGRSVPFDCVTWSWREERCARRASFRRAADVFSMSAEEEAGPQERGPHVEAAAPSPEPSPAPPLEAPAADAMLTVAAAEVVAVVGRVSSGEEGGRRALSIRVRGGEWGRGRGRESAAVHNPKSSQQGSKVTWLRKRHLFL